MAKAWAQRQTGIAKDSNPWHNTRTTLSRIDEHLFALYSASGNS